MGKLQVLCATMHQKDFSKIKQMNIQTDVLFANQAQGDYVWEMKTPDITAKVITTKTRGVGKNRNIALENATGEICLFADDDVIYIDGYEKIILDAFSQKPDVDAIVFNVETIGKDMLRRTNLKMKRVRIHNCFNYGAVRIAVKLDSVKRNNLVFSEEFGGGAPYSSGEDSIFMSDMIKKKMKVYTHHGVIAKIPENESTWFCGYNEKYLYDKGALFCALSKPFASFLCLQDLLRHPRIYKENNIGLMRAYGFMKKGIKGYKKGIPYREGKSNE